MNLCLMSRYLTELDDELCWFPSPSHALEEPNGLLAIGGKASAKNYSVTNFALTYGE